MLPVNLQARIRRSARICLHWFSLTKRFWYSPLPKPASVMASSIANAHRGVDGECFKRIELPIIKGGIADLNGSQNGKFHGKMPKLNATKMRPFCGNILELINLQRVGPSGWCVIIPDYLGFLISNCSSARNRSALST